MKRSYNSVGAGETPKMGCGDNCCPEPARPGGPQSAASVVVSTDIPKAARPGGYGTNAGPSAGLPPRAARPGGAQSIR